MTKTSKGSLCGEYLFFQKVGEFFPTLRNRFGSRNNKLHTNSSFRHFFFGQKKDRSSDCQFSHRVHDIRGSFPDPNYLHASSTPWVATRPIISAHLADIHQLRGGFGNCFFFDFWGKPGTLNNQFFMVVSIGWFKIFTWEMVGNHQTSIYKWLFRVPGSCYGCCVGSRRILVLL